MFKEFKAFALKGNVMDLAIGVIIGAAFGKIVSSLVNDIIMPIFSLITGNRDFSNWYIPLDGKTFNDLKAAKAAGVATINYGTFLMNVIDFLIIAFSIFIVIRWINKLMPKKPAPVAEVTTKECPYCTSTISIKATKCPHCTSSL